jgi:hypothetical protein
MLISHTIQIVDRDQIQNGKNISGSILRKQSQNFFQNFSINV